MKNRTQIGNQPNCLLSILSSSRAMTETAPNYRISSSFQQLNLVTPKSNSRVTRKDISDSIVDRNKLKTLFQENDDILPANLREQNSISNQEILSLRQHELKQKQNHLSKDYKSQFISLKDPLHSTQGSFRPDAEQKFNSSTLQWEGSLKKHRERMTLKKIVDSSSTDLGACMKNFSDKNTIFIQDKFVDTNQQLKIRLLKTSMVQKGIGNGNALVNKTPYSSNIPYKSISKKMQSSDNNNFQSKTLNFIIDSNNTNRNNTNNNSKMVNQENKLVNDNPNTQSKFKNANYSQQQMPLDQNQYNIQSNRNSSANLLSYPISSEPISPVKKSSLMKQSPSKHQPSRMKFTAISQQLTSPSSGMMGNGYLDYLSPKSKNKYDNDDPHRSETSLQVLQHKEYGITSSSSHKQFGIESTSLAPNLTSSQCSFLKRTMNLLSDEFTHSSTSLQNQQKDKSQKQNKDTNHKRTIKFNISQFDESEGVKKAFQQPNVNDNEIPGILTNGSLQKQRSTSIQNEHDQSEEISLNGSDSGDENRKTKKKMTEKQKEEERKRKDKQLTASLRNIQSIIISSLSPQPNHQTKTKFDPEQSQQNTDGYIKINKDTLKKYQGGIDIEKEIMEQKINIQRNHQKEVAQLISTIQNNAMENFQNQNRMKQSVAYKSLERKSKILEESKLIKKKQFEENLKSLKDKNEFEGVEIEVLENEFATGGKFCQKNYNNIKINRNLKRTRQQIIEIFRGTIKLLQRLNLDPQEVMVTKIFSTKPFEKENSYLLFQCVKANDTDQVSFLLKYSKYLVYDYDYVIINQRFTFTNVFHKLFMTPLQWACKRGFLKMVNILINFNSDLEAEDMVFIITKTRITIPLFVQRLVEHLFILQLKEILKILLKQRVYLLLLANKASPYKTKYVDYTVIAKSYIVLKMLSVCRRLHWTIKLNNHQNKAEHWKKEISVLYAIRQQQQVKDEEQKKKKVH